MTCVSHIIFALERSWGSGLDSFSVLQEVLATAAALAAWMYFPYEISFIWMSFLLYDSSALYSPCLDCYGRAWASCLVSRRPCQETSFVAGFANMKRFLVRNPNVVGTLFIHSMYCTCVCRKFGYLLNQPSGSSHPRVRITIFWRDVINSDITVWYTVFVECGINPPGACIQEFA